MAGPFGPLPADIASALNRGNYGQAIRKGGEVVAKEITKGGKRMIQPIEKLMESTLQKEGMREEFTQSAELAEELEGVEAEEIASGAFTIARALGTGLATLGEVAGGAAASEVIAPLALFCLIGGLVICMSAKPAVATPLKQEFRRLKSTAQVPKLPRFPAGQVSDRRLKHSVRRVRSRPGQPRLYTFCFLGDDVRYTGVLAQELLADERFQHAVHAHPSGFLAVDYGALGLDLRDLEPMRRAGEKCVRRCRTAGRASMVG